jgi:dihydrofolate reductase
MRVFILTTTTVDGFIAQRHDQLVDWSSHEDKRLFVRLTKEAGVIVMGSRTFDTLGRALKDRKMIVYTSHPEKYSQLEGVETTQEAPEQLVKRLEAEGHNGVAICGGAQVYDEFLRSGVVQELYVVVEPLLFGEGINLCTSALQTRLKLVDTQKLNDNTILLHYALAKTEVI